MKVTDFIFAIVAGRIIGFLINDFLKGWGISIGLYWTIIIWIVLPFITVFCLWLTYLMGRKFIFVFQAAKFLLVGVVATIVDLKLFEFLAWTFTIYILAKIISFIFATLLKYWGNKYWTFQKHEKENIYKEIINFFSITFVGLVIDVAAFYYFTKIMGPQFNLSAVIWIKLSVIFAAITAALWNFSGYKFLVFKK